MSLVDAARKLYAALKPHGVVIGGICGAVHGVERFTRDVDLATDWTPEQVIDALHHAGIAADVVRGDVLDPLPWVIRGELDGVPFQVLPAAVVGVDPKRAMVQVDIGFACERDFIVSKCIAGGQQDMHDVAVLALKRPELLAFAEEQADRHACRARLDAWMNDRRLQAKLGETR